MTPFSLILQLRKPLQELNISVVFLRLVARLVVTPVVSTRSLNKSHYVCKLRLFLYFTIVLMRLVSKTQTDIYTLLN